jgi:uncharacterized membrane protein
MDPRSARLGRRPARGDGSARLEVLVPVPIGVAVAVTAALLHSPAVGLLLGWDTVAVLYIGWLAFVLQGRDAEQTARRTTTDPDRVATDVALLHLTALHRTVLRPALLSYLFGTGILATTVNLVATLRSG